MKQRNFPRANRNLNSEYDDGKGSSYIKKCENIKLKINTENNFESLKHEARLTASIAIEKYKKMLEFTDEYLSKNANVRKMHRTRTSTKNAEIDILNSLKTFTEKNNIDFSQFDKKKITEMCYLKEKYDTFQNALNSLDSLIKNEKDFVTLMRQESKRLGKLATYCDDNDHKDLLTLVDYTSNGPRLPFFELEDKLSIENRNLDPIGNLIECINNPAMMPDPQCIKSLKQNGGYTLVINEEVDIKINKIIQEAVNKYSNKKSDEEVSIADVPLIFFISDNAILHSTLLIKVGTHYFPFGYGYSGTAEGFEKKNRITDYLTLNNYHVMQGAIYAPDFILLPNRNERGTKDPYMTGKVIDIAILSQNMLDALRKRTISQKTDENYYVSANYDHRNSKPKASCLVLPELYYGICASQTGTNCVGFAQSIFNADNLNRPRVTSGVLPGGILPTPYFSRRRNVRNAPLNMKDIFQEIEIKTKEYYDDLFSDSIFNFGGKSIRRKKRKSKTKRLNKRIRKTYNKKQKMRYTRK